MSTPSHPRTVGIVGTGAYLPARVLTNAELETLVDTTDEWIRTRTGISERRIAADGEATSDMAAEAARRALADAGVAPEAVDMIIVATVTPDMPFPSTACLVQHKLGARQAFCFDIEAACAGFLYAMETARQFIALGTVRTALVIGAEKLSAFTDWKDRATCVLFGDGAGAVVMSAAPRGRGLISSFMGSDGGLADLLQIPAGGSRTPPSPASVADRLHYMKMTGNEVFKHAVRCMCDAGQRALERGGLTIGDVAWVIPHQANLRIIQAIAARFGDCLPKFVTNLDRVGNMSGASIPVALDEAVKDGRIKRGDLLMFVAFGGGFTWGASVMEWDHGR